MHFKSLYILPFNIWLSFGLVVSYDVFQQQMDAILEWCPGCTDIAYDVSVGRCTEKELDDNLWNLMRVAEEDDLVFNSEMCVIKTTEIPFFWMLYTTDGNIKPDPDRNDAIKSLKSLKTSKQLEDFLGIYSIYFLSFSAHRYAEKVTQEWDKPHEQAFTTIKALYSTSLAYFNPGADTMLQVDSSLKGIRVVLMQNNKPIVFGRKALTETESRCANIE